MPPLQTTSTMELVEHSFKQYPVCYTMIVPTPSLNANSTVIAGGVTDGECDEMKFLTENDEFTDKSGSEIMYVVVACVATVVVACMYSSVYQNASCNALDDTTVPEDIATPPSNVSSAAIPSMVVEASEDSGFIEGVSTTRGDNSSSESNSDKLSKQAHKSNPANVEACDDQCLRNSQDALKTNMHGTNLVTSTQTTWQSTGIPPQDSPVASVKKEKQVTGKSLTDCQSLAPAAMPPPIAIPPQPGGVWEEEVGDRDMATSVHSPHSESDDTCAEEVHDDDNKAPNVTSMESLQLISGSEGLCEEESRKYHHNLTSPRESGQDQVEFTATTTTDDDEPQPEVQILHNQHDASIVMAGTCTFDGGGAGISITVQMFVMEPQPHPQPEMWHLPVQESGGRRNDPSQLVVGRIIGGASSDLWLHSIN